MLFRELSESIRRHKREGEGAAQIGANRGAGNHRCKASELQLCELPKSTPFGRLACLVEESELDANPPQSGLRGVRNMVLAGGFEPPTS